MVILIFSVVNVVPSNPNVNVHFPFCVVLSRAQRELSQTPSYSHTSEEESRQMEEILRLEREIERLQKQQEDGVSLLGDVSQEELRQMRDAEIFRLEKEASRVATEFLELLDFGGLEPSLSSEENLHDPTESTAPLAEEEVDEGFHAEEECVPLPDFPPPAAVPLDKDVFQNNKQSHQTQHQQLPQCITSLPIWASGDFSGTLAKFCRSSAKEREKTRAVDIIKADSTLINTNFVSSSHTVCSILPKYIKQ